MFLISLFSQYVRRIVIAHNIFALTYMHYSQNSIGMKISISQPSARLQVNTRLYSTKLYKVLLSVWCTIRTACFCWSPFVSRFTILADVTLSPEHTYGVYLPNFLAPGFLLSQFPPHFLLIFLPDMESFKHLHFLLSFFILCPCGPGLPQSAPNRSRRKDPNPQTSAKFLHHPGTWGGLGPTHIWTQSKDMPGEQWKRSAVEELSRVWSLSYISDHTEPKDGNVSIKVTQQVHGSVWTGTQVS